MEDRTDLSPLDPFRNERYREAVVSRVMSKARSELARRRERNRVIDIFASWSRPVLAAASLAAIASLATLASPSHAPAAVDETGGVVEALQTPDPIADWLIEERDPESVDIMLASWNSEAP